MLTTYFDKYLSSFDTYLSWSYIHIIVPITFKFSIVRITLSDKLDINDSSYRTIYTAGCKGIICLVFIILITSDILLISSFLP